MREPIDFGNLWRRRHNWISIATVSLLVVVCYGFVIQLPFFFDDLPVMTWLGWHDLADIWTGSSESYYRPLPFTIYKLGLLLPMKARQVALHATNLLIHWTNAVLIGQVVKLHREDPKYALLAAVLFAVFPFMFLAVPWITAMPHHLVTLLTLLATYAALRAERDGATWWWGISLAATALAPFAHESGYMSSAIVGGLVLIKYGVRVRHRRTVGIVLGGMLSAGALLLRSHIHGADSAQLAGLQDWVQNSLFFLHGLLYPVAPAIGWLVNRQGGHDFTLIAIAAALFSMTLIWLARRSRDWRWAAGSLWWWVCGALPAAVSLRYGRLYISPRLYALSSVGAVMVWAHVIIELGKVIRTAWGRRLTWALLAGLIVTQNVAFLQRQRALFQSLNDVYGRALEAAEDEENAPLGFVNLPSSLAWPDKTYALILETVVFIPPYSDAREFVGVNRKGVEVHAVTYPPVLQAAEQTYGFEGEGIGWEEMRQFAAEHRTVWLTRYYNGQIALSHVGTITAGAETLSTDPLVRFEGGPVIESAAAQKTQDGQWAVAITWLASGPVDGEIFVHIVDADHTLVAQADGPALGGMVPIWLWQPGDRIYDVRHIVLSKGNGPYTVQVGVYNKDGRFPAFADGTRCQEDAAPVTTIVP